MIFQHTVGLVLDGRKTETRRPRKPGDRLVHDAHDRAAVVFANGHTRYRVGRRYAIQPGRGHRAVGSFVLAGIRPQALAHITDEEIAREGFPHAAAFWATWTAIHHGAGSGEVWVLTLGDIHAL